MAGVARKETMRTIGLGWKPDLPDYRDYAFASSPLDFIKFPRKLDWWDSVKDVPPCYNQLQTSSCVGNSTGRVLHLRELIQGEPAAPFMPSRLFLYFNARQLEGASGADDGARIRDCIKSTITEGVCPESEWPFDPTMVCAMPSQKCYDDAKRLETISYKRIDNLLLRDLIAALNVGPVVGGISVYTSFISSVGGIIPMPKHSDTLEGGHALAWTGYSMDDRTFTFDNSWGPGWGQSGRGKIPFEYLTTPGLASDFWLISKLS